MGLFGGGNSSSSQYVTTNNDASNMQAGQLGFRGDGNTTTISQLDGGSIAGAFNFGSDAMASLEKIFTNSLAHTEKSSKEAIAAVQSSNNQLAAAYKTASGGVDQTRAYIIVASLIAVVAGLYFLRAKS